MTTTWWLQFEVWSLCLYDCDHDHMIFMFVYDVIWQTWLTWLDLTWRIYVFFDITLGSIPRVPVCVQVPPIPLGDLFVEQIKEMGPHFRYNGDHATDNQHTFDLSGALMVTGLGLGLVAYVFASCHQKKLLEIKRYHDIDILFSKLPAHLLPLCGNSYSPDPPMTCHGKGLVTSDDQPFQVCPISLTTSRRTSSILYPILASFKTRCGLWQTFCPLNTTDPGYPSAKSSVDWDCFLLNVHVLSRVDVGQPESLDHSVIQPFFTPNRGWYQPATGTPSLRSSWNTGMAAISFFGEARIQQIVDRLWLSCVAAVLDIWHVWHG